MNLIEINRALRQLRLGGIAAVLETRLQQAQAEPMAAPSTSSPVWYRTNSRAEPTGCWSDEENKHSFAIRRKPSTTSISTSTKR